MKLLYVGPFGLNTGYAQAMMDYCRALVDYQGDAVELAIMPTHEYDWRAVDASPYVDLLDYVIGEKWAETPTHVLIHANPWGCNAIYDEFSDRWPDSAKTIAMTTWESEDMPLDLEDALTERFNEIIVPSQYCQDVMMCRPRIVPHCFDDRAISVGTRHPDRTDFLYVGAWNHRKNPMGAVIAYLHAFTKGDAVSLTIKTGSQDAAEDIKSIKRSMNLEGVSAPINLITGTLSDAEILQLHYDADVFVSAHRGEGFGLGPFLSAAVGNRLIVTGYGGPMAFTDGCDWHVKWQPTPALTPERKRLVAVDGRAQLACVRQEAHGLSGTQVWAEPNLQDMANGMREMHARCGSIAYRAPRVKECRYEIVAEKLVANIR